MLRLVHLIYVMNLQDNIDPGPSARQELVCWMALHRCNDKDVRDTVHFESNSMWQKSKGGC